MPTMKRLNLSRALVLVPACALVAVASCSSSTSPPLSAYITSTLGTNPANLASTMGCTIDEPGASYFTVGTLNGQTPDPVPSGSTQMGNPVMINCEVASNGSGGYDVDLEVNLGMVGAISLFGTLTDSLQPQSTVNASFTTAAGASAITYSSPSTSPCVVTLSPLENPAITAGRVWGSMVCDILTDAEVGATCLGTATFLFQECSE